jgi:hypothetical protein
VRAPFVVRSLGAYNTTDYAVYLSFQPGLDASPATYDRVLGPGESAEFPVQLTDWSVYIDDSPGPNSGGQRVIFEADASPAAALRLHRGPSLLVDPQSGWYDRLQYATGGQFYQWGIVLKNVCRRVVVHCTSDVGGQLAVYPTFNGSPWVTYIGPGERLVIDGPVQEIIPYGDETGPDLLVIGLYDPANPGTPAPDQNLSYPQGTPSFPANQAGARWFSALLTSIAGTLAAGATVGFLVGGAAPNNQVAPMFEGSLLRARTVRLLVNMSQSYDLTAWPFYDKYATLLAASASSIATTQPATPTPTLPTSWSGGQPGLGSGQPSYSFDVFDLAAKAGPAWGYILSLKNDGTSQATYRIGLSLQLY